MGRSSTQQFFLTRSTILSVLWSVTARWLIIVAVKKIETVLFATMTMTRLLLLLLLIIIRRRVVVVVVVAGAGAGAGAVVVVAGAGAGAVVVVVVGGVVVVVGVMIIVITTILTQVWISTFYCFAGLLSTPSILWVHHPPNIFFRQHPHLQRCHCCMSWGRSMAKSLVAAGGSTELSIGGELEACPLKMVDLRMIWPSRKWTSPTKMLV